MTVPYNGAWFYPPRGQMRVPYKAESPIIKMWKGFSDSLAQFKQNGTNCQLKVFPDHSTIELWSRHKLDPITNKPSGTGEPAQIKNYTLTKAMREEVLDMTPRGVWTVYNCELMHSKTTAIKNTLYFFDTLVWQGQHLIGVEYAERYQLIADLLGDRFFPLDAPEIDGRLYIAENISPNRWDSAWSQAVQSPYCEGLVLKRIGAVSRLQYGDRGKNNCGFLCRVRKPQKNFGF